MTNLNKTIGERVRFYRTTRNISLAKIIEFLPNRITPQQLARYETGKSRWPVDLLCEIAAALAVDVMALLGLEAAREQPSEDEMEAEKYKAAIMSMKPRQRDQLYRIIDMMLVV